jgi:hypothetical protein
VASTDIVNIETRRKMPFKIAGVVEDARHLDDAAFAMAERKCRGSSTLGPLARLRGLPTFTLDGDAGGNVLTYVPQEILNLLYGMQGRGIAALDGVEAFLGGGAKPSKLGFTLRFALLQEP